MNHTEQTREIVKFHVARGAQGLSGLSHSEQRLLAGAYYSALLGSDESYARELIVEHVGPWHMAALAEYIRQSSKDITAARGAARQLGEVFADMVLTHMRDDLDRMIADEVAHRANMAVINAPRRPATGAVDRYRAGRLS